MLKMMMFRKKKKTKDEKIVEPCSNCLKHLREKSTKFVEENKICGRKKNC